MSRLIENIGKSGFMRYLGVTMKVSLCLCCVHHSTNSSPRYHSVVITPRWQPEGSSSPHGEWRTTWIPRIFPLSSAKTYSVICGFKLSINTLSIVCPVNATAFHHIGQLTWHWSDEFIVQSINIPQKCFFPSRSARLNFLMLLQLNPLSHSFSLYLEVRW